jgi:flagellar protein FliS
MFGSMKSGANAYAKVGVETGVMAASPHKLIVMLFEGAMVAVGTAAKQMASGDIAGKGKSISKAISIIEEGLRASLDRKAGGEIAANLDSLYQYMNTRLVIANRDNQADILEEVQRLLGELKGAWEQIAPGTPSAQPAQPSLPPMQAAGAVLMRA